MGRVWTLWPGLGFAFSAEGEEAFIAALSASSFSLPEPLPGGPAQPAGASYGFDRDDVTVLMSLLRCGADVDAALGQAPGLLAASGRVLSAYALLSSRHSLCLKAWGRVAHGSRSSALRAASRSARLMPSPTRLIRNAPSGSFEQVRSEVVSRVSELSASASEAHRRASELGSFAERADAGAVLFHPYGGGLFRSPWFLPDRVSALSPEGVAALLPPDLPQGRI